MGYDKVLNQDEVDDLLQYININDLDLNEIDSLLGYTQETENDRKEYKKIQIRKRHKKAMRKV